MERIAFTLTEITQSNLFSSFEKPRSQLLKQHKSQLSICMINNPKTVMKIIFLSTKIGTQALEI